MNKTLSTSFLPVNPPELGTPSGFSHGLIAPPGARVLFVAGQTASDGNGRIVDGPFDQQFEAALSRVIAVVSAAGGRAEDIGRMAIFVTDLDGYIAARPALGQIWKRLMGSHYPAITLVGVSRLVEPGATVEIEATAVLSA